MNLNILWFILISVLFAGYFVLEGFDFGVGLLLPFLGKDDTGRRVMIQTIGPVWDGNEVWLIVAGGATFAAFPNWYATLFSGFYLPLVLILLGLILRGVSFEFRGHNRAPEWRNLWDGAAFVGSLLPSLLWGVAFANLIRGVPIDGQMQYTGGFWNLLNWYALLGGLVTLCLFTLHGAVFLALKTTDELAVRARRAAALLSIPAALLLFVFFATSAFATDLYSHHGPAFVVLPAAVAVALLAATGFLRTGRTGWAFSMTSLTIAGFGATLLAGLYPRVMISSLNPQWSLDIYNAASSPYTLRVMSIVAAIFMPVVLLYQGWSYWVFRRRVSREDALHY